MTAAFRALGLAVLAVVAVPEAQAADHLTVGPVPAWVQPHVIPSDTADPTPGVAKMLLRDNQISFDADGGTTSYWEDVARIASPESLAKLANIAISWNPDTDSLTIHRVHIVRNGKVLDVLATQSFATLRREQNLERASVDGRLTASLQIAGLQIGDVVDLAASRHHLDPALRGHRENMVAFVPGTGDSRLVARWPTTDPVRWHRLPNLPDPVQSRMGTTTALTLETMDLREPVLPKNAPVRYRQADAVQLTDWKDWAQISALMAPLYAKASTLAPGGPIAQEAAKIAASTSDPMARTEAALRLVQDQVRYLYVGLNDGGYLPAAADETWQRRFGDCKGKTALLLGLLHTLGIEAQPVLVNTGASGDAIPGYLPAAGLFNHVLVRATIAGKIYWLDGTRLGDRHLALVDVPAFHWGLPIQPSGAALVPIMPGPPSRPLRETMLRIDASAGVDRPVPAHADIIVRGDGAQVLRRQLASVSPDVRDRGLRDIWRRLYDFIEPEKVSASFDPATGAETMSLDGVAKLDWNGGALELSQMQIGGSVDYVREAGSDPSVPFAVAFPHADVVRETIVLPGGGEGFSLDPLAFDQTIAGVRWQRHGRISNGVAVLDKEVDAVAPEFPAAQAADAQETLRRLTHQRVYLHRAG